MRSSQWCVAFVCALLCADCAPVSRLPALSEDAIEAEKRIEQIAQIRIYYAELHRVDTVAFRIRTANRADCRGWESAQIGLYAVTPQSLPRKYRSYSREALDITWLKDRLLKRPVSSPVTRSSPSTAN